MGGLLTFGFVGEHRPFLPGVDRPSLLLDQLANREAGSWIVMSLWLRYWVSFTHFPLDWLIINIHGFCLLVLAPLWLTVEQVGWNFGIVVVHACVIAFASAVITKVEREGSLLLIAAGLLGFGVVFDTPKAILLYYAFGGFAMCASDGGCLPPLKPSIGQVISALMPFLILRTPFFVLSLVLTGSLMNRRYSSDGPGQNRTSADSNPEVAIQDDYQQRE